MSQLAIAIEEQAEVTTTEIPAHGVSALTVEIAILGALLCVLQIADGVLTGVGVTYFGTSIEGNLVLRYLMENYGVTLTLVSVKLIAVGIIFCLCNLAYTVSWLRSALKIVITLYLFAAVLPWSYILFSAYR